MNIVNIRIFFCVVATIGAVAVVAGHLGCSREQTAKPDTDDSYIHIPFALLKKEIEDVSAMDFAEFREIGISAIPPTAFDRSQKFHGFSRVSPAGSVTISTSRVSYEKSTRPYLESLARQNPKSLFRPCPVGSFNGCFLHQEQEKGEQRLGAQHLVFGNDQMSWIVSASYLDDDKRTVTRAVAKTLLSIRPREDADLSKIGGDTKFALASKLLKPTMGWTKTLVFTEDGNFPLSSKKAPFVKATEQYRPPTATEQARLKLARSQILPSQQIKVDKILYEKPFQAGTVDGIEFAANAFDHSTSTPIILYFAMLFEKDSQITIHAWAGRESKEQWMAEFEAIARSYSR